MSSELGLDQDAGAQMSCQHEWTGEETTPDGLPHSCAKCGKGYLLSTSPRYGQWATEPPTEPGWYWVKQGHNPPIVAWVRELDRKMRVKLFGNAYHNDVDEKMFTHWMRIEAPEPPK